MRWRERGWALLMDRAEIVFERVERDEKDGRGGEGYRGGVRGEEEGGGG